MSCTIPLYSGSRVLIFLILSSSSSREQEMWDERRARDRNREVKPSCEVMRESSLEGDLREAESGCRRHARTQVASVVAREEEEGTHSGCRTSGRDRETEIMSLTY